MGLCANKDELRHYEHQKRINTRTMKLKSLKQVKQSRILTEDDVKRSFIKNFDKYDQNKDEFLEEKELVLFFRDILKRRGDAKGGNMSAQELAKRFIDMVDIDGDRKITRHEIYQFYKE